MKKDKIIRIMFLILTIFVNIFIIVNGLIKGVQSANISNNAAHIAADAINAIQPETITSETFPSFASFFRKFAGHFCMFGLNGIFSTITIHLYTKNTVVKNHLFVMLFSSVFGFLIAFISEMVQKVTEGRVYSIRDVGIDFIGYCLGIIFAICCLALLREKIFKFDKIKKQI